MIHGVYIGHHEHKGCKAAVENGSQGVAHNHGTGRPTSAGLVELEAVTADDARVDAHVWRPRARLLRLARPPAPVLVPQQHQLQSGPLFCQGQEGCNLLLCHSGVHNQPFEPDRLPQGRQAAHQCRCGHRQGAQVGQPGAAR